MVQTIPTPQTIGFVPEYSYLWHFIHQKPIKVQSTQNIIGQHNIHTVPAPASVQLQSSSAYLIGIDLGNNGPKAAMFGPDGSIVVHHVQAVLQAVQDLAAGDLGTTYEEIVLQSSLSMETIEGQMGAGDAKQEAQRQTSSPKTTEQSLGKEWIGREAVNHDGYSLSKGSTRARLSDPRYARFLLYVIAGLFNKAGYPSGDYDVLLATGMPNEEIHETANGSQLDPQTQQAMSAALCQKRWRIRSTDRYGRKQQYNVKVVDLAPGPQSYAGFYAWQFRPNGTAAQSRITEITLEDMGANDLHELTIRLRFHEKLTSTNQKYCLTQVQSATRERKGDGIILALMQPFGKKLKKDYGLNELDDATAQQAFFERAITVGGFCEPLDDLVRITKAEEGARVITNVFQGPAKPRSFYMIAGGGNVLLRNEIIEKLTSMKRSPKSYVLLGEGHASLVNAVGLLAILDQMCRIGKH